MMLVEDETRQLRLAPGRDVDPGEAVLAHLLDDHLRLFDQPRLAPFFGEPVSDFWYLPPEPRPARVDVLLVPEREDVEQDVRPQPLPIEEAQVLGEGHRDVRGRRLGEEAVSPALDAGRSYRRAPL